MQTLPLWLARWLRRGIWTSMSIMALLGLLLAISLVFIDTSVGHQLVRRGLEKGLNEHVFTGRIHIERIEGSLYSDFSLFGVKVEDKAGHVAVSLDRVRLAYDLRDILWSRISRVHIRAFEIDRPSLFATQDENGRINLAYLVRTSTTTDKDEDDTEEEISRSEEGELSKIVVQLDALRIEGGSFRYLPADGPARELRDFGLEVSGALQRSGAQVLVQELAFDWVDPLIPVRASAQVDVGPGSANTRFEVRAREASLRSDNIGAIWRQPLATTARAERGASGRAQLRVPSSFLRHLLADPNITGDLDLGFLLSDGPNDRPWRVDVNGHIAEAPIAFSGTFGSSSAATALKILGVNPQHVYALAPPGLLDLASQAEFTDNHHGRASLSLDGELELLGHRYRMGSLTATATMDGERAGMSAHLIARHKNEKKRPKRGEDPELRVATSVQVTLPRLVEPIRIDQAEVLAEGRELSVLTGGLVPMSGSLHLDLAARGALDALDAQLRARASRFRLNDNLEIEDLALRAEVNGLSPEDFLERGADGQIDVDLENLRARTSVLREPIELTKSRAKITLHRKRSLDRVAHGSTMKHSHEVEHASDVVASWQATGRRFLRKLEIEVSADQVFVTERSEALPRFSMTRFELGTPMADWRASPTSLAFTPDGSIVLSPFRLESSAGVVEAEGRLPLDNWTAGAAKIDVRELELGAFSGVTKGLENLSGRLSLRGQLTPSAVAPDLAIEMTADDVRRFRGGPIDASVAIEMKNGRTQSSATIRGEKTGSLGARLSAKTPAHPQDLDAWTSPKLIDSLSVELEALSLNGLLALTSTTAALAGRVDGGLEIAEKLERARAQLSIRDLSFSGRPIPADIALQMAAGPERIDVSGSSTIAGAKPVRIAIHTNVGTKRWTERGPMAVLEAGTELELHLEHLPAEVLRRIGGLASEARSEAQPRAGRPDSLRPGTGGLASEARSEAQPSGAGRPDSLRPGTGGLASDPRFDAPRGTLSFHVRAKATPEALTGEAQVLLESFALARHSPELDLDLKARFGDGRGTLDLQGELQRSGKLAFLLEASLPTPSDIEGWTHWNHHQLRRARGQITGLRLGLLSEMGIMLPDDAPEGQISADFAMEEGLERGEAHVQIDQFRAKRHSPIAPLNAALHLSIAPESQTMTATVTPRRASEPIVVSRTVLRAPIERLLRRELDDVPVDGSVRIPNTDLQSLFRRRTHRGKAALPVKGRVQAQIALNGSLSKPIARVQASVLNAWIGDQAFEKISVVADYAHAIAKARLDVLQGIEGKQSGSLQVDAQIETQIGTQIGTQVGTQVGTQTSGQIEAARRTSKDDKSSASLTGTVQAKSFELGFITPLLDSTMNSAIGVQGVLSGQVAISGPLAKPEPKGTLEVERLRVVLPGEIPPLEGASLHLALEPTRYQAELKGKLGEGEVTVLNDLRLESSSDVLNLTGSLRTQKVRLSAGPQIVSLDASVDWSGHRREGVTQIAVVIGDTQVEIPKGRGKRLRAISSLDEVELVDVLSSQTDDQKTENGVAKNEPESSEDPKDGGERIVVTVRTPTPITARGGENHLELDTDLTLDLGPTKQQMVGRITVGGRLAILRRRYDFQRGEILFPGAFPPDPRLDLRLASSLKTMTLIVVVDGTAKEPKVRFESQPGGRDQAALLAIFLGADPGEASKVSGEDAARAAASALASQLATKAGEDLPFDTIELDMSEGNGQYSILAGKWITDDIFIAYHQRLRPPEERSENQSEGVIRWHFAPGWNLESRFGNRAAGRVEAIWLKRF